MYLPDHFREDSVPILHQAMRQARLATLVTLGPDGLTATHLPMLIDPNPAPYGTLRGHFARANPHWRHIDAKIPALAMFLGPNAYVTPSWYPTKKQTGKVVPTWNYIAVHAYGPAATFQDHDRLMALVTDLTKTHESPRKAPWAVSDAPPDYVDMMLKGIVGLEIPIQRLEGKWKLSQNRTDEDRAGVAAGMADEKDDAAQAMAAIMHARKTPV